MPRRRQHEPLRVLLNKRSRTNLAFDVGFGENGNRGVYLTVQEAF